MITSAERNAADLETLVQSVTVDDIEIANLLATLKQLGVESVSDLSMLTESDLISAGVKLIHARKLLGSTSQTPQTAQAAPQIPRPVSPPLSLSVGTNSGMDTSQDSEMQAIASAVSDNNGVRQSKSVVVMVDVSGSMAGARIQKTTEGVCQTILSLHPDDIISLYPFNDLIGQPIFDSVKRSDISSETLMAHLKSKLRASGSTSLYDSIGFGLDQCSQSQQDAKVLIVFTDGADNKSSLSLDLIKDRVLEPSFDGFSFIAMAINPPAQLGDVFEVLTPGVHTKLIRISTHSAQGRGIMRSFGVLSSRISAPVQTYQASEGFVRRSRCHSPSSVRCASEDEDDYDYDYDSDDSRNLSPIMGPRDSPPPYSQNAPAVADLHAPMAIRRTQSQGSSGSDSDSDSD